MDTLESVPSFSEWQPRDKRLAILLSQGLNKSEAGRELGISVRTVRNITNKGTKDFSPEEFQQAIKELSITFGIGSKEFWLQVAHEILNTMKKQKKFPDGKDLLEFVAKILDGTSRSTMKTEISIQGSTFSEDLIKEASRQMREKLINARSQSVDRGNDSE